MVAESHEILIAYTDGACAGNPGPGGWAWAIDGGASDSGGELASTNQRMLPTVRTRPMGAPTGETSNGEN